MVADLQYVCEELERKIKLLEAENKTLREREFSILRDLPEIVFLIDMNERFTFLNNTCIEKFKFTEKEMEDGKYLKDIITAESLIHIRKLYLKGQNRGNFHAKELTAIHKDGCQFPFTAYFSKIIKDGLLSGFIGIGFDISERIDIENKLKESNLAKMKFLSIIAHDLRSPFNSLVGFSTLLLTNYERYNEQKIKEYIEYMSKAANHGHQLLENLLDWARANTRKIDINPVIFNLNNITLESVNLLQGIASKKEINIYLKIPTDIYVYADQNMIRTIIRNLISNAIKFTPRKGVITIQSANSNENVILEVIDNGVGIDPLKLPNLFSLSNDYTTLGTEKERGTGLGLILCNEFIQLNYGKIEAESTKGKGSIFKITIPKFKQNHSNLLPS
jgi:PAS domain S-box-containing protein